MPFKKAVLWTTFWFLIAMGFATGVYFYLGQDKTIEFLAGYIIELSLSIDNLFLFLMLFSQYGIDSKSQRIILNWGIAGAVVMRLVFILLGITIVNRFHWVMYIFGFEPGIGRHFYPGPLLNFLCHAKCFRQPGNESYILALQNS